MFRRAGRTNSRAPQANYARFVGRADAAKRFLRAPRAGEPRRERRRDNEPLNDCRSEERFYYLAVGEIR